MKTGDTVKISEFYKIVGVSDELLNEDEKKLYLDKDTAFPGLLSTGEIVEWELVQ